MYELKHRWNQRTQTVADLIEPNKSIIDIGCADKDFLNFYKTTDYIGIDKTDKADIQIDLNIELYTPNKKYDYCLFLGVLEYLENPNKVINFYKQYSDTSIILFSNKTTKKKIWTNFFTETEKTELVSKHFYDFTIVSNPSFVIYVCSNIRT